MSFLKINKLSDNSYESEELWCPFPGYAAFGGQLAAQSLLVGLNTVPEDCLPNLVHTLFINPGDPKSKITYEVERLKDGNHLSMREIRGIQNGTLICTSLVSVSKRETNTREFSYTKEVIVEDEYIPLDEYIKKSLGMTGSSDGLLKKQFGLLVENLGVLNSTFLVEIGSMIRNRRQIRISILREEVGEKEWCLFMTLVSDLLLVESALLSLNVNIFSHELYKACSIDHNLHFIKPNNEKTVYYVVRCDNVVESKAVIEGKLVDGKGDILCLTSQQALIRIKK